MEPLPIARLLSATTRLAIERMHDELAAAGHPGLRPAYGYALVAVGEEGATASGLAAYLGMTKQGAAKLVASLEGLGYLVARPHEGDGRARLLTLTARGRDLLDRSREAQAQVEREWAALLGEREMRALRRGLERALAAAGDDAAARLRPIW